MLSVDDRYHPSNRIQYRTVQKYSISRSCRTGIGFLRRRSASQSSAERLTPSCLATIAAMADNVDAGSDAQITFKVKASSDKTHTLTMSEVASVKDLKDKLSGEEYENIPAERQRLIYSGRVMKNEETLGSYKIKPNNTIHLVKSAASNPGQPAASSNPTSNQSAPVNMSAGTANNPLAGLTGARYAGHGINLPGMDMFGPDGGVSFPVYSNNQ